ncbi:MAG TPA: sigma-70 family RNA polymerase sigma factor [Thermoanaerobaculia bacterium]|nr:sigma-70 family RNA polymerase sigma factor [Thermoanaerobaculia bacterium]
MLPAIEPQEVVSGRPPGPWGRAGTDLADLFQRHHERIYHAAYRITGSTSDAEDVLQTVFLRLVRRETALDPQGGIATYLHRAAVNAALDLLRAKKRARSIDLAEVEAELESSATDHPDRRSTSNELRAWLRRAVSTLSPRAAEIFSLRYLEGYGNREIAEMLGSSETAIAVLLHRTRARLGRALAPVAGGLHS